MTDLELMKTEHTVHDRFYAITNVRAVLPDRVLDNASVVVEDGIIAEVVESGTRPRGAIDGANLLLLPGLVDTHSDGLEKEASPRRTAHFELDYAISAFEGRLRSSGVTTVFHGVGYQERSTRTVASARATHRALESRQATGRSLVDHHVLFRFEARDPHALEPMLEDLTRGDLGRAPLISFEDHTPGQGQYRDLEQFAAAVDPASLPAGVSLEQYVLDIVAEAETKLELRDRSIARLAPFARSGEITMLAHDTEHASDIEQASAAGATVAEFPITVEAARAARAHDMRVVMGAPNALRGSSHSGNVSARELVESGLCDALASDYLPPAMLASAFVLADQGHCSISQAIGLITSGPADLCGFADRGRLAVGQRADLVLVDDRDTWPAIVGVRRADDDHEHRIFG